MHRLQTRDNVVRDQEFKYSAGPRPPLSGGMAGEGPRDQEGTPGAATLSQGLLYPQPDVLCVCVAPGSGLLGD